jgi:hypothetical protein
MSGQDEDAGDLDLPIPDHDSLSRGVAADSAGAGEWLKGLPREAHS